MKNIILAITLALTTSACLDDPKPSEDAARDFIMQECGPAPQRPGLSFSFETVNSYERVLMTRSTYDAMTLWMEDTAVWNACVQGHTYNPLRRVVTPHGETFMADTTATE